MRTKLYFIYLVFTSCLIFIIGCKNQKSHKESKSEVRALLIDGNWELNYIAYTDKSLSELYTTNTPSISINSKDLRISGNASCNNITGSIFLKEKEFHLNQDLVSTKKLCPMMDGEDLFIKNLMKISSYSVTKKGNELVLISGDMAIMRFHRK